MLTFKQNQAFWLPIIVVLNLLVLPALIIAAEYKVTRVIDGDNRIVCNGSDLINQLG
jgi:hypothetical protein